MTSHVSAPELPPRVPRAGGALGRAVGRATMRLTGWRFEGGFPDIPKFVTIIAPHTSNWDFFVALQAKLALGLEGRWMGKHTIFRWPIRWWLLRIGGIPIDRRAHRGIVDTLVAEFAARDAMVLVIAPEGTRRRVEHWKTGYWNVAHKAGVPIVPVGLDYGRKRVTVGDPLTTTDSLENDEALLRAFFAPMRAKVPENYVP